MLEYRGFCGWTYQGTGLTSRRWTFRCECGRCSMEASEVHNKCCWCDPTDSRHVLLTASRHEKAPCHHCWDQFLSRDQGKILFKTTDLPYGSETSWVGRRKNTCMKVLHRRGMEWQEGELPSWQFRWCGICSIYYAPGRRSRKKSVSTHSDDPFLWGRTEYCRRECVRHALDPKWGDGVPRAIPTFKMRIERLSWWENHDDGIGEPRVGVRSKQK